MDKKKYRCENLYKVLKRLALSSEAKEELQRLKPFLFCELYVAAEAATHKSSRVVTRTLKPRPPESCNQILPG